MEEIPEGSVEISLDDNVSDPTQERSEPPKGFGSVWSNLIILLTAKAAKIFYAIFAICVLLELIILIIATQLEKPPSHEFQFVKAKEYIEKHYNPNADPCHDFYQYSCGKALASNDSGLTALADLEVKLSLEIKDILEDPSINTTSRAFEQAKKFYSICKDSDETNEITTVLASTMVGKWPILHQHGWNASDFNLEKLLVELIIMHNVPNIFQLKFDLSENHFAQRHLLVHIGKTGIPREFLIRNTNEYLQAYKKFILKIVSRFTNVPAENLDPAVSQDVEDIVQFEVELAKLITNSDCAVAEETSSTIYYTTFSWIPLEDMERIAPGVHWTKLTQQVHATLSMPPDAFSSTFVAVKCLKDVLTVAELARKVDQRIIANYLIWRFVLAHFHLMGNSFKDIWLEFQVEVPVTMTVFSEDIPEWSKCVSVVNTVYSLPVAQAYMQKHPELESSKSAVEDMAEYLLTAMEDIIIGQQWLKDEIKSRLLEKLADTHLKLGYPSLIMDDEAVDKHYKVLELHANSSVINHLEASKFMHLRMLQMTLNNDPDRFWYEVALLQANAFHVHDTKGNALIIPVTLLRQPFFSNNHPMYLNFAKLGFFIGHEIAHAFDRFTLEIEPWWRSEETQLFQNKTQCYVEQYGKFRISGIDKEVNGTKTLDENLNDILGLRMARLAYELWRHDNNAVNEPLIPEMNFTLTQLFFLTNSELWCERMNLKLARRYATDAHSPGEFRVNGVLANDVDFGTAFNCPVGSPMNPASKCKLWE